MFLARGIIQGSLENSIFSSVYWVRRLLYIVSLIVNCKFQTISCSIYHSLSYICIFRNKCIIIIIFFKTPFISYWSSIALLVVFVFLPFFVWRSYSTENFLAVIINRCSEFVGTILLFLKRGVPLIWEPFKLSPEILRCILPINYCVS